MPGEPLNFLRIGTISKMKMPSLLFSKQIVLEVFVSQTKKHLGLLFLVFKLLSYVSLLLCSYFAMFVGTHQFLLKKLVFI